MVRIPFILDLFSFWRRNAPCLTACCLLLLFCRQISAADQKYWDISQYQIEIQLAVDESARPQPGRSEQLVESIREKIFLGLFPLWNAECSLAKGKEKNRLLSGLEKIDESFERPETTLLDKKLFLAVHSTNIGYQLECREYDYYLHRWSRTIRRQVQQQAALADQCFYLLQSTFSPLAAVEPDKEDKNIVRLNFKGSGLPLRDETQSLNSPGEVYLPLLVRTNTAGEILPENVKPLPWTYLTLKEQDSDKWLTDVHSGIRTPYGIRRRGRVQQLAIALRYPPDASRIRFHARHSKEQSLSGYEVFERNKEDEQSNLLGLTDSNGTIKIMPNEQPVQVLFLRSDGQLLAKIPVAPGAKEVIEVPVGDDPARLRAQAALVSLREELIDLVARRNILMARIRDRLKNGKVSEAQDLFSELDSLPSSSQFAQKIDTATNSKLNRSEDKRIQSRIDKMFDDTRKLLGRFLNTSDLTQLKNEILSAQRQSDS